MQVNEYVRSDSGNQEEYGSEAISFINEIIDSFKAINCSNHFSSISSNNQISQKTIINQFQTELKSNLDKISENWKEEFQISEDCNDRVDLFAKEILDSIKYNVIVELDKSRADQLSKKFISRTCHSLDNATIYFAFCYPGTKYMPLNECKKYLSHCSNLTLKLHSKQSPRHFIGLTVE